MSSKVSKRCKVGELRPSQALTTYGIGAIIDLPDPKAKEDWVVVKVQTAPMCTEYKAFLNGGRAEYLGHEAAGEVVEVAQPGRVKVGDRVVVMPQNACGKCARVKWC